MAKKLDDETQIVFEGDYFSCTYNRKKIRGIVEKNWTGTTLFLYNNIAGEDTDCGDTEVPWKYVIEIDPYGTETDLKDARVTNYTVLKDKRQQAVIDKDRLPVLETEAGNWKVDINKNTFIFGCGYVKLTKEEIEGYLRWRKKYDEEYVGNIGESQLEDLSNEEIKLWQKYQKDLASSEDYMLYKNVIKACEGEIAEDEINDISEGDIKALFKYMDWKNKK